MVWRSSHPDINKHDLVWINDEADALVLDHRDVTGLSSDSELRILGKEPGWPVENCVVVYTGDGSDLVSKQSKEFYFWWKMNYAK